jgi:ATP-dependent DNA helicase RecQ
MRFLPESTAADNIWQTNLRKLLGDWIEETHGYEQSAGLIAEYLYETLADQGRSRNLGNGVFLSTVHSVKGLEFDHVFLLGDNWQGGTDRVMEEERRLFYVGMSRARQTLHLLQVDGMDNPHAGLLCGDFLLERRLTPGRKPTKTSYRYALLGMEDLFLDFAGIKGENSPAGRHWQRCNAVISCRCTIGTATWNWCNRMVLRWRACHTRPESSGRLGLRTLVVSKL